MFNGLVNYTVYDKLIFKYNNYIKPVTSNIDYRLVVVTSAKGKHPENVLNNSGNLSANSLVNQNPINNLLLWNPFTNGYVVFTTVTFCFFLMIYVKNQNTVKTTRNLFPVLEQNFLLWDDMLIVLTAVLVFLLGLVGFNKTNWGLNAVWYGSLLTIVLIICYLPACLVYSTGVNITVLAKGSVSTKGLLRAVFEDFIGLPSLIVRFFIQTIRLFLILITYTLLYEYIFISLNKTLFLTVTTVSDGLMHNIFTIIVEITRVIFEITDLLFIVLIQLSVLILVVVWLFPYLFSTNPKPYLEKSNTHV